MPTEMILRYLYYLTHMVSGNSEKWKICYDAWHNFSNNLPSEEYEKILTDLNKFSKKYLIKKS
jgi:hypothetical protein